MPDKDDLDEELGDGEDDIDLDSVEEMSLEEIQAEAEPEDDGGFDSSISDYPTIDIPLDELTANDWNPNEMSSEEFNRLAQNIEEDGFLAPIQAVPVDEDGNNVQIEDWEDEDDIREGADQYRIVGGEHRWSAAKVTGMTEIPTVVVPDRDEQWEKLATVRMNVIKGELDPIQFADLVEEQRQKFDDDQSLKEALGFAEDDTIFDQVLDDIKESAPEEIEEEIEEHEDELESIDDLSELLNRIFRQHGDELDYHFITFSYGGEDNVMFEADDELWSEITSIKSSLKELNASAIDFWNALLDEAPIDEALHEAEGTADVMEEPDDDDEEVPEPDA